MAYEKQNFQPNTTLYANDLNEMDDQIALNEADIADNAALIQSNTNSISSLQSTATSQDTRLSLLESKASSLNTMVHNVKNKTEYFDGTNEDALYIVDKNNNVIAVIDRNGILSTNFLTPRHSFNNISEKTNITSEIWKTRGQYIHLALDGLKPNTQYTIELIRRPSRTNNHQRWTSLDKNYGYQMLANTSPDDGITTYGPVPSFMTNQGKLKNKWTFNSGENTSYTLSLHAPIWLLDLCKPTWANNSTVYFNGVEGENVNLIGQSINRPFKMLAFSFNVYNMEDILVHEVQDTIYINGALNENEAETSLRLIYNDVLEHLQLENLRISIK